MSKFSLHYTIVISFYGFMRVHRVFFLNEEFCHFLRSLDHQIVLSNYQCLECDCQSSLPLSKYDIVYKKTRHVSECVTVIKLHASVHPFFPFKYFFPLPKAFERIAWCKGSSQSSDDKTRICLSPTFKIRECLTVVATCIKARSDYLVVLTVPKERSEGRTKFERTSSFNFWSRDGVTLSLIKYRTKLHQAIITLHQAWSNPITLYDPLAKLILRHFEVFYIDILSQFH